MTIIMSASGNYWVLTSSWPARRNVSPWARHCWPGKIVKYAKRRLMKRVTRDGKK